MTDIQNEIRYCAAWQMIHALLKSGDISQDEFDTGATRSVVKNRRTGK